jgi:hypothetical protein
VVNVTQVLKKEELGGLSPSACLRYGSSWRSPSWHASDREDFATVMQVLGIGSNTSRRGHWLNPFL